MARDILNRCNQTVGIDQRLWIVSETGGYGRDATGGLFPLAANGVEHINMKMEFNIPREDAAHRSGRSRVVRLSGKKEVKWSYEGYIIPGTPSGLNPTLPDTHPMILSAFGAVNETVVTQKVYTLTRCSSTSFRMLEEATHFSRLATGLVADVITFSLPGDGKAMMKVEGFGQDVISAGQGEAAVAGTATNQVTVGTGQGQFYELNSYIDIIDFTDGNTRKAASRKITAIVGDTLTFDGAAVTFVINDIVIGAAPDFTADSSENALLGLRGSFSTAQSGAIDCELLSAEISLKNNYTQINFAYGTDSTCGFIADKRRDVSLKFDVLLTKANYDFYQRNKTFVADAVTIVLQPQLIPAPINAAAGRTWTFTMPKVEFNTPQIEQPGDSYVKLSLEGVALAADINTPGGELVLTLT